jgi:SAM-dependent methyltransferase
VPRWIEGERYLAGVREQPGYDALADVYDQTFPTGYVSQAERSTVDMFVEALRGLEPHGPVVDVGCGTGHQSHDLASRGFHVIGADPSSGMLERARRRFPALTLVHDDAFLGGVAADAFSGVLARYSLIHVPPDRLGAVLSSWADRLQPGGVVLVAFQALDPDAPADVEEFDHAVAPAWRWKPDAMAHALARAGLTERWRLVTQPSEGYHRFPECHLMHTRRSD